MSGDLMAATAAQQSVIMYGSVISLYVSLALVVFLVILSWGKIRKAFSQVSRKAWLGLIIIAVAALAFRLAFVPETNRVYFDEDLYENMARNILLEGKSCMCNGGNASACYDCILNKAPAAHPFLMSLFFRILGPSREAGFAMASATALGASILIFLSAYLLFHKKEEPAILSVLLLNILPVFNVWANTLASETTFVFLSLLALVFLLLYREKQEPIFLFLVAGALSMAAQCKAETGLLFPLFYLALVVLCGPRILLKPAFYLSACLVIFLCGPHLLHTYLAAKGSSWGATGPKFSLEYFKQNLPVNAGFFLFGYPAIEHPLLVTILALLGLAILVWKGLGRQVVFLSIWFLAFFTLYTSFYAGSVLFGTDVRYVISFYVPFILLASSAGLAVPGKKLLAIFCAILVVYFFLFFFKTVSTPAPEINEANQARAYAEFARSVSLPMNCTIFSHVSALHIDLGRASVQPWYLEDPAMLAQVREKTSCLVFDYGYWCTVPPFKEGQCKQILDKNPNATKIATDPTTGRYSFYLLS
jgi:hypothetical protein